MKYLKLLCHAMDGGHVDDDCWQTKKFYDIVLDWFVMVICEELCYDLLCSNEN